MESGEKERERERERNEREGRKILRVDRQYPIHSIRHGTAWSFGLVNYYTRQGINYARERERESLSIGTTRHDLDLLLAFSLSVFTHKNKTQIKLLPYFLLPFDPLEICL